MNPKQASWLNQWPRALVLALGAASVAGCGEAGFETEEGIGSVGEEICKGVQLMLDGNITHLPSNSQVAVIAPGAMCDPGQNAEYRFLWKIQGGSATPQEFRPWDSSPVAFFDNTGRPSGKYTLIVYARNIGSSSNSQSMKSVYLSSGNLCTKATLTATPKTPKPPGTDVTFTATADCTENDADAEFLFKLKPQGSSTYTEVRGWDDDPVFLWDTDTQPIGAHTILVQTRGQGNPTPYEGQKSYMYTLADNCNIVTASAAPPTPEPVGALVTVTGGATCVAGSTAFLRYRYRSAVGNNPYSEIQDWDQDTTAEWDTTGLAPGLYQVRVESRAPGLTGANQGYRIINYSLTDVPE